MHGQPDEPTAGQLQAQLAAMRAAFAVRPHPPARHRAERLRALQAALLRHQDALCEAMSADFGGRSMAESRLADVLGLVLEIRHALRHLRRWMKPQRRHTELLFRGNAAWVEYQPKGVVGVIAPWNFPCYLALGPLIAAVAAGNRVMLKMSEFTPATTVAVQRLLAEVFDPDEVFATGGPVAVAQAFSALPFDHLVFTGSTAVGREVMRSAAEQLVPVTLELGGKSPAIVSRGADLHDAAAKLAHGKSFNAGQICIAPDYALVPAEHMEALAERLRQAFCAMHPQGAARDEDYTCVVTPRHAERIHALLQDAADQGARIVSCGEAGPGRRIPLQLVLDVKPSMRIAREELFGPILPLLPYGDFDEVVRHLQQGPRPLALYYFGRDRAESARLRRDTHAGGMTLNDWGWHVFQNDLPFGGIGPSGMGSYHGVEGFRTLSHAKSVFQVRRFFPVRLFHPPYGGVVQRLSLALYLGRRPSPSSPQPHPQEASR
ncbi:coniferyl aldehyde dehydrogenase [uncultured Pseudacidovorax sp.]|uniref:coniferyl aldehyde dehydrogenase n=1 Tax=uncultured Pseudacidovorax sp. TaxID=679313 RepID=UPI0025DFCAEE|nr:coniferyl aldehyde dehydrogenase [uncultured Pseudacidovorax sp.]